MQFTMFSDGWWPVKVRNYSTPHSKWVVNFDDGHFSLYDDGVFSFRRASRLDCARYAGQDKWWTVS